LYDFHREQCWDRWLSTCTNGIRQDKELVLGMLRNIAKAETENDFEKQMHVIKESEIWLSKGATRLRSWLTKTWFSNYKVSGILKRNNCLSIFLLGL